MSSLDRYAIPDEPERFPSRCPFSGLSIRTRKQWQYTNDAKTYRTTVALIGEHIFWVIPRGYITETDMRQAIQMAAAVKAEAHPGETPFAFIENFALVKGATVAARRLYLDFTNSLEGLLGSFPYGLPPFFRLSFNFSRRLHLHRYKVRMVPRYEDAVRSAMALLAENGTPVSPTVPLAQRPPEGDVTGEGGKPEAAPEALSMADDLAVPVDQRLTHLGGLDLERPGIPDLPPTASRTGAMQAVYEALMMLKTDMDQFLSEHRSLMAARQERHQRLLQKTAAIEARNRELQALLQKSGEDQKQMGANARRNVQTLLKPLVAMIAQDARSAEQREWIDGLNERIDDLAHDLLPRFDLRSYRLTPQEIRIARLIRDGSQSKAIARQLGLSVRTVESFRRRLRAKFGIRGQPRNLRTILLTIPDL